MQYHGETYLGEHGKALAIYDDNRKVFRSVGCQEPANKKRVCSTCATNAKNVSNAMWRLRNANVDNWQHTPPNSIKGLLAKDSFILKLRGRIAHLKGKVVYLEAAAAEDISSDNEIGDKESLRLVKMLMSVVQKGFLNPESFTFCIIKQQLACLLQVRDNLHSSLSRGKIIILLLYFLE